MSSMDLLVDWTWLRKEFHGLKAISVETSKTKKRAEKNWRQNRIYKNCRTTTWSIAYA